MVYLVEQPVQMYPSLPVANIILILLIVLVGIDCREKDGPSHFMKGEIDTFQFNPGSSVPFLHATKDRLYISWIQSYNDKDSLYVAIYENQQWTNPRPIANGTDWFVNWADFPAIQSFSGIYKEYLVATWLVKSDTAKFSYDIFYSVSPDLGLNWISPQLLNEDALDAEHGFVSMDLISDSIVYITWLDGRKTASPLSTDHHSHNGEMTLRGAKIDVSGLKDEERELDNRVCDCCQTSVTVTDLGPLIAYRDRSLEETRDIALVAINKQGSISTQIPNADQWKISGCPVNGPALISRKKDVVYAWYTAPDNLARCKISFSKDGGLTFGNAIRFDEGNALGRIDLCWLEGTEGLVSWMEKNDDQTATLSMKKFTPDGTISPVKWTVAVPAYRQSGFPKIDYFEGNVFSVWTDSLGTRPCVKMTAIPLNNFD